MKLENDPKFKLNAGLFTVFTFYVIINLIFQVHDVKKLKEFLTPKLTPILTVLQETYCEALGYKRACEK